MRVTVIYSMMMLIAGCGTPSLLITPVQHSNKLQEMQVQEGTGLAPAKIVLIEVEGMLINTRRPGLLGPGENKLSLFTQQMEKAAKDDKVKAVVLRINSPGGTVTCSDTMYQAVREFRAKTHKPVIASMQEVGASGAYYVACGADAIVAHPTSVVGSVGVIFNSFDVSGTLSILGVKSEAIKSGKLKDMASPLRPLDPEARAVMQAMIQQYHARFVGVVTDSRKLTDDAAVSLATDGRVFSGQQAMELRLVDRLGRLEDAIALAKELSRSPGAKVVMYKRPFGYSGSIYADASIPEPRTSVLTLDLPESELFLPAGFYYLWQP